MQNQQSIKLEMNLNEVNLVIASLAKLPYETVFTTLENIRSQAERQVKESVTSENLEE